MNEIRFNDIYKNYVDLALKTAVYYCKDKTAAEDIVQLAFAKLYVNYDEIRNIRGDRSLADHNHPLSCVQPGAQNEPGDSNRGLPIENAYE